MKQDMIVILDLGSTENTVIARDIRSLGVYSEIHPHDITPEQLLTGKGIDTEYKDTDMDYEVTRSDIRILKQIHSLGDDQ